MDIEVDSRTTVGALKTVVQQFCEERDWDQFHSMKELAIGLVTESAELLDLMRFKSPEQISDMLQQSDSRERVSDELADIAWMLFRFCQLHGFDLSHSMSQKLKKNAEKYPVEKSRGSNRKYNEF